MPGATPQEKETYLNDYPISPQYTAGQTGFTLNTTNMVTAEMGTRTVEVIFQDGTDATIENYTDKGFSLSDSDLIPVTR